MAQVDMKGDVPVGTIVPFFGAVSNEVIAAGWLDCNGATLAQADWPDLFAAIGQAFGYQTKDIDFCLPDLHGTFPRTVDAGGGRDPGTQARTASGPNKTGTAGDAIGSFEPDATAMPAAKFTVSAKLAMGGYKTHDGCSKSNRIKFKDSSGAVNFDGGDAESRPVNLNAVYLIKAKANSGDNKVGPIPLGAAIALPVKAPEDTPLDDYWRYGDGQTFIAAEGSTFYPLYLAIGTANGGVKATDGTVERFAIPDFRGLFLRAVGQRPGTIAAGPRETPRPDLSIPGNDGDKPGSYQNWATAPPRGVGAHFRVSVDSYPFDSTKGYQAGYATAAAHTGNSQTFNAAGGDAETRPRAMSVEWYVRFRSSGDGGKPGEELPVGVIVATGSAVEVQQWQPCQGQILLIAEYDALSKLLGKKFGGDGQTTFGLPDLRGRFLRGVGDPALTYPRPRGTPVAEAGETQDYSSGAPRSGFSVKLQNWPGSDTNDIINYGTGTKLLKLDGDKTLTAAGGDAETRPVNIYVQHLIKVLA